jgi:hypothetical protein
MFNEHFNTWYEFRRSIELARLGYLFANGKLSADDASDIIYECQPIAGYFVLETIDVDGLMAWARDRWVNADDARALAEAACERVAGKWSSTGDVSSAAQDWAMDLLEQYAREDGITLIEIDHEDGEDAA